MKKNKLPLRACERYTHAQAKYGCNAHPRLYNPLVSSGIRSLPVILAILLVLSGNDPLSAQTYSTNYLLKTYNASSSYVNSQLFDNGVNVGISNALPNEKLDVSGNVKASGSFISRALTGVSPLQVVSSTLVTNLNTDLLDGCHANSFAPAVHTHSGFVGGQGVGSQVAFWSSDSILTGTNALFWDYSTHRLGIGTDAPEADLHLYSGSETTGIILTETHQGMHNGPLEDSQWGIHNHRGQMNFSYYEMGQPVEFVKLTRGVAGGTMEVKGNLKTTRLAMTQGASLNYILTSTATGTAVWKDPLMATGWSLSGGDVYKINGFVGIGTQQMQARCHIQTNNVPGLIVDADQEDWGYAILTKVESPNVAAFAIEQSGQNTLMIWGDGRIHASKVRVKVPVFPDFVFDQHYVPVTIPELQTYIQQNGHLPDFPAAAEVERNGLDLGEMNTLLVQKIEELTLYVIQLYNENKELRDRMDAALPSQN